MQEWDIPWDGEHGLIDIEPMSLLPLPGDAGTLPIRDLLPAQLRFMTWRDIISRATQTIYSDNDHVHWTVEFTRDGRTTRREGTSTVGGIADPFIGRARIYPA